MAKYKLKKDFLARGNAYYPVPVRKPGDPPVPMAMRPRVALTRQFKEGEVVEGEVVATNNFGGKAIRVTTDGAMTYAMPAKGPVAAVPAKSYAGLGNFGIDMAMLDEEKEGGETAKTTGGEAAKTDAPGSATNWKKIGAGFVVLALIAVILAYVLKKRSAKELAVFGLIGGAIGGIGMFFLKDKKVPIVDDIAKKVGGGAGTSGSSDLAAKMATAGQTTVLMMLKAFGAPAKDMDEMKAAFKKFDADIKKAYADELAKLSDTERKAVNDSIDAQLSMTEKYKNIMTADASTQEKMQKEGEAAMAAIKAKYPGINVESLIEKVSAAANEKMKSILPKLGKGPITKEGRYIGNTMQAWEALNAGPLAVK